MFKFFRRESMLFCVGFLLPAGNYCGLFPIRCGAVGRSFLLLWLCVRLHTIITFLLALPHNNSSLTTHHCCLLLFFCSLACSSLIAVPLLKIKNRFPCHHRSSSIHDTKYALLNCIDTDSHTRQKWMTLWHFFCATLLQEVRPVDVHHRMHSMR